MGLSLDCAEVKYCKEFQRRKTEETWTGMLRDTRQVLLLEMLRPLAGSRAMDGS
jgi:hypothetical protein